MGERSQSLFAALRREIDASLESLDFLVEQGVMPDIEAGDFRASLELMKKLIEEASRG